MEVEEEATDGPSPVMSDENSDPNKSHRGETRHTESSLSEVYTSIGQNGLSDEETNKKVECEKAADQISVTA